MKRVPLAELLKAQRWRNRAEALIAIANDTDLRRRWYRDALREIASDYIQLAAEHEAAERRRPH